MKTAYCPKCGEDRPIEEFYKTKTKRGVSGYCKKHTREAATKRQKEKAAEVAAYNKKYREEHREELNRENSRWQKQNRNAEYYRKWRQKKKAAEKK
jgi:hypothetical protein